MFFIENEGQAVAGTDYWQSVQAQAGYVYLSWNAGAARLLVPDAAKHLLREMRGAEYVIISKGTLLAAMRWNWYLKTAAMRRL